MKQTSYWVSILCGLLGCLAGLAWVYYCCLDDPDAHRMVSHGWDLAKQGLSLGLLGTLCVLSTALGRIVELKRQTRRLLLLIGAVLLILGGLGVLSGLGLVCMICLAGWYEGEPWGRNAMIGWLIVGGCALFTLIVSQQDTLFRRRSGA